MTNAYYHPIDKVFYSDIEQALEGLKIEREVK